MNPSGQTSFKFIKNFLKWTAFTGKRLIIAVPFADSKIFKHIKHHLSVLLYNIVLQHSLANCNTFNKMTVRRNFSILKQLLFPDKKHNCYYNHQNR